MFNKLKEGLFFGFGFGLSALVLWYFAIYQINPLFDKSVVKSTQVTKSKWSIEPESDVEVKTLLIATDEPQQTNRLNVHLFTKKIPKPDWFYSVLAPDLNSISEIDSLWRGKKRCCVAESILLDNNREFYKSCYNAIINNPDNEKLVVKCLWLMDTGADGNQRTDIKRFLVNSYGTHKNSVVGCVNCAPADTVARVTQELANVEKYSGNIDAAIRMLENLFDYRGGEISLWIQTEIYQTLGKLYMSSAVTETRKERMKNAYTKLNSVREFKENGVERRFAKFEQICKQVIAR